MKGMLPEADAFTAAARTAPAFIPWPWPAAVGCALGISSSNFGASFTLLASVLLLVAPTGWWLLRRAGSQPVRALAGSLLVLLCLLPVGYLRFQHWNQQADPLAGLYGQELELSGTSDGNNFRAVEPVTAVLAVSPRGALPPGAARITGILQPAAGKRNPGGFDHAAYLRRRGIPGQLLVRELLEFKPAETLRERLRRTVRAGLSDRAAALVEALTLGVRDELGDLRDTFAAAGIAHLLALSGLHVGVLLLAVGRLLRPLGRSSYLLLLLLLIGYVQLIGVTPSILRAALMAGSVLLLLLSGYGRSNPWTVLTLAALLTLLFHPAWLFDQSFQLSYGAVAGILLLASPLVQRSGLAKFPWWHPRMFFVAAFYSSVSAQLPVLSLTASSFGSVPLFSPLVNLLAIPLATLLVPLGNAAAVLGLLLPAAGASLNGLTGLIAELLITLSEQAARLPALPWGEVSNAGHYYWLLTVLAFACAAARVLRPSRALIAVLCALLASSFTPSTQPAAEFVALDVGQGDSVLLRFPGRINVLVDGGGAVFSDFSVGTRVVVPALRALGVNHLDLVIATHADFDHMGGLPDVLALLPVQHLVLGQDESHRPVYTRLLSVAAGRGVAVSHVRRGERLRLGKEVELVVLNPRKHVAGASNDESVGIEVHYRGVNQALLLGDLPIAAERALTPAPARILLVPHHGSRHSTSMELLRQVAAEHAVISVGRNNYGHPHPSVLQRLEAAGLRIHQTLTTGAVRLPLSASGTATTGMAEHERNICCR